MVNMKGQRIGRSSSVPPEQALLSVTNTNDCCMALTIQLSLGDKLLWLWFKASVCTFANGQQRISAGFLIDQGCPIAVWTTGRLLRM
jgi:hypothetical protein